MNRNKKLIVLVALLLIFAKHKPTRPPSKLRTRDSERRLLKLSVSKERSRREKEMLRPEEERPRTSPENLSRSRRTLRTMRATSRSG
jgi:hypothetical protein